MSDTSLLRDKVIVQFGGTGLLGRALVASLGGSGATLIIASRNRPSLESLAAAECSAGRTVHVDEVDIGDEASLHGLRDRVLAQHGRADGIYNPEKPQAPGFLERYAKTTMLGRMADAREIGGAVVFLLSDASTYITGTNLPVDGGYTAK